MSGIKEPAMTAFYRKLRARGHTITSLADVMMCGRTHLTLVINGDRPGTQTWRKLKRVLTAEELALLEQALARRPREGATFAAMSQPKAPFPPSDGDVTDLASVSISDQA